MDKLLGLEKARRQKIIEACLREFSARGYDDASSNVMAREAGLSKPLMFHYIGSKKEFYLFLYDYCMERLRESYFAQVDYGEGDILARLRKTYLLKIRVMQDYPLEFAFINTVTLLPPKAAMPELAQAQQRYLPDSTRPFYDGIDATLFREGLDIKKCLNLIYWAVAGYAGQLQSAMAEGTTPLDFEEIRVEFDAYLTELRKSFYREEGTL